MKRILLFLVLIAAVSAACRKPKKPQPTPTVSVENLIGNWEDENLALSSSMLPNTYSFKTDRTYMRSYGITTEQGAYQLVPIGTTAASIVNITMIPANGTSVSTNARIELTSRNRFVLYYNGSTAGRPFVRVP
ncbi:hypothetical protein GFS24_21735 [Chitinophaga sp. SYP-B3965]|uniref:hypothetical protein n=1 Tax=Chitinophaga sp. SYP-B3965 TaxID=2663120 RepID=UPI0012998BF4|nr:hypothetical protein [Chitinophaga sp. SYP-B3965]MRG47760.1 hypothetical protein [Chitinophaga sp. SYP-B3965]